MKQSRNNQITKVSIVGIGANAVIAAFKVIVGLLSNSVAVLLDAINNVSDALSSAITIIGVKLAGKKPDSKHPFGYGRVEYFSAILVAGIIFAAGVSSMIESVKAILNPEPTSFTWVSVMVIVVAIVGKLILGRYFQNRGKVLNSDALVASGLEASYDAVLSAATLLGAAVSMIWNINIDGYIGVIISAFIIKTGIETLLDPLGKVVGKRVQGDLATAIKSKVAEVPGVLGAYDLILHDYGPDTAIGSIHVEVSDTLSSHQIQKICRRVSALIYSEFRAVMTVGIYVMNDTDAEVIAMREDIRKLADHNTPYSKGTIYGVLKDMVVCTKELMLDGKKVKIGDLAIFSLGIHCKGVDDPNNATVDNIRTFSFNAQGTGEMRPVTVALHARLKELDEYAV